MTVVKFGLRDKKTKQIVGFITESNVNAHDCGESTITLSVNTKNEWLVNCPEQAEYVRLNSTPWYNSDYSTPVNTYSPNDLEVIRISKKVKVEPYYASIPSVQEYIELKFGKDSQNYRYLSKNKTEYSLYDLVEFYQARGVRIKITNE